MNICGRPDRPEYNPDISYEHSYGDWREGENSGRLDGGYLVRLGCGHVIYRHSHRVRLGSSKVISPIIPPPKTLTHTRV